MFETIKAPIRGALGKAGMRTLRKLMGKIARHDIDVKVPVVVVGYGGDEIQFWPEVMPKEPTVYSLGVGNTINADLELIDKYNAKIFAFDPTPESQAWIQQQTLPNAFRVFPLGVASFDGKARFFQHDGAQYSIRQIVDGDATDLLEVRRLRTLMDMFRHDSIDLLKIDIEGGEYQVIPEILESGIRPKQICVEFHHRLPGYRIAQTYEAVTQLRNAGYRIIAISDIGREYTFLKV
jgi:FkbM family methyltransferase